MRRGEIEQAVRKRGAKQRDDHIDFQVPLADGEWPPAHLGKDQQDRAADDALPEGDAERRAAGDCRDAGQRE